METGIEGLQYQLYYNTQVMNDWSEYALESTTDFGNYYNVGNYDGKALRIIANIDTGMTAGNVACLADVQKYTSWEDGAICLQWISSATVRTHRLTPNEWHAWYALDVGDDGVVRDPTLTSELPNYLSGASDFESWEIFTCDSVDENGFTCDAWLRAELSTRNGFPRFLGGFGGQAALVQVDATDNTIKRVGVDFTYEAANPLYTITASFIAIKAFFSLVF